MSPRQVMINTVAVLFVLGLAWVTWQVRSILLLLALGIIFAAAVEPIVYQLRRRGVPRSQSIISVYAALLAVLGLVIYLIVPPLVQQASALVADIPNIIDSLRDQALASDNDFIRTTGFQLANRAALAYEEIQMDPPIEAGTALTIATSVGGILFTTVSMMIVAFYWMTEKATIKRLVLSLFSMEHRDTAHDIWDQIEAKLGGWVRGQLTVCAFIGLASAIGYFFIGLDFWLALGIWAGITNLIPFIGPFLGGAAAVIVALTESWQVAVMVIVFVVVIQQVESTVLTPRVMRNAVGLTPLTVILAVFAGGTLIGVLGAVLAIPFAAAIQVMVQYLLSARSEEGEDGTVATAVSQDTPPPADGAMPTERRAAEGTSDSEAPQTSRGIGRSSS